MKRFLLALCLVGCTHEPSKPPAPSTEPAPAATPAPAGSSASIPEGKRFDVVATVLETGPIGDGACTQRSYRVKVTEIGANAKLPNEAWIHYEHCAAEPESSNVAAGQLEVGRSYRFTLERGASKNFGNEPMIVGFEKR